MPKIFITRRTEQLGIDKLKEWCSEVEIWEENRPVPYEILAEKAKYVDAIFSQIADKIDENILKNPNLKIVAQQAVGTDNIDLTSATKYNVIVSHTPGVLAESCADHAWALMLAVARRLHESNRYVMDGGWRIHDYSLFLGLDVHGKTLGVVGPGQIGTGIVRRASGFSMNVLYNGPHQKPHLDQLGAKFTPIDQLLAESDFVILCCPLTPETKYLINLDKLKLMKSTAILVNIARGPVVVTKDLVEALKTGIITAAGLDVTDPEPINADNELLKLPNCLVVSHIASSTIATRNKMSMITANAIIDCLEGRSIQFQANKGGKPKQ